MEQPPAYTADVQQASPLSGPEQRYQTALREHELLVARHETLLREHEDTKIKIDQTTMTVKKTESEINSLLCEYEKLSRCKTETIYKSYIGSQDVVERTRLQFNALNDEHEKISRRLERVKPYVSGHKQIKDKITRAQDALNRYVELDLERDSRIEITKQKLAKLSDEMSDFYSAIPDLTAEMIEDLENMAALGAILLDFSVRRNRAEIDLSNAVSESNRQYDVWTNLVLRILGSRVDVSTVTPEQLQKSIRSQTAYIDERLAAKYRERSIAKDTQRVAQGCFCELNDQITIVKRSIRTKEAEIQSFRQQLDDFRRISSVVSALPPHYELDELRATVREQGLQIAQLTRTVEELVARLNSQ